jgi:hypothetical protein
MWNDQNSQTNNIATGLNAGTYTVTLTDSNNCQITEDVTITTIGGPIISITAGNISCNGRTDGIASPSVSGSPGPFTYLWDDQGAQTTAIATGLSVGNYNVTVTDANGCINTESVNITQPPALYISYNTINSSSNNCTGEASVSANGGTVPYLWLWDNGSTSNNLSNLCPGAYIVNVTDANGCTESTTINIGTILSSGNNNENSEFIVFPNPFTQNANLSFELFEESEVLLEVFNLLGESITIVVNKTLNSGKYTYRFNKNQQADGIYIVKFVSNGRTQIQRLIQLK